MKKWLNGEYVEMTEEEVKEWEEAQAVMAAEEEGT